MKEQSTLFRLFVSATVLSLTACGGGGSSTQGGGSITQTDDIATPVISAISVADGSEPKHIEFSWAIDDISSVAELVLLENADGTSGFSQVASAASSSTSLEHELSVHLTDWINASYMIEARNESGDVLASSDEVNLTQALSAQATGYLKTPTSNAKEYRFGSAVAISGDGSTLAVSELGAQEVYIYSKHSDNSWGNSYTRIIPSVSVESGDNFGRSIGLSYDGSTLVVAAPGESSDGTGINGGGEGNNSAQLAGAVYVFIKDGATYSQQAYIKASNTGAFDQFGYSVALNEIGNVLAVGAPFEDSNGVNQSNNDSTDSGAVYVFERDSSGVWSQEQYIKATEVDDLDGFGFSVSLAESLSGTRYLAVGATGEDSDGSDETDNSVSSSGAAYVFIDDAFGDWSTNFPYYIKASNPDEYDRFGGSVSLSSTGETLAVSAVSEDSDGTGPANNSALEAGAAYVFSLQSGNYTQTAYFKASNAEAVDRFGRSLSLSGDGQTLAIGANEERSSSTGINGDETNNDEEEGGAAYVFTRAGNSWSQKSYVKASNTEAGDAFGYTLSLSGDGSILAVGAREEDSQSTGVGGNQTDDILDHDSGAVYLY